MNHLMKPRGDVARLPKWAIEYIGYLKDEIDRQANHINEISSPHPGSNVMLDTKIGRPAVTLPPDSTVQFYMAASRDLDDIIEIHHNRQRPGILEVTAYGGSVQIQPHSGNAIRMKIGDY